MNKIEPEIISTLGMKNGIGTIFLQRKLRLSYCEAARLIEEALAEGVIEEDGEPYRFRLVEVSDE